MTEPVKPYRASFAKQFMRSKNGVIGAVMVGLFLFCALFAPLLTPGNPAVIDLSHKELAPSISHPMGTDNLGRDVFSRVVHGTRISLRVGVIAMIISIVIGTLLGAAAGFFGGKLDSAVMRLTDVFLALPAALLALAVMAVFENPSINKIFIVLGFIGWTTIARLVRSRVMEIRNEEYVIAEIGRAHV